MSKGSRYRPVNKKLYDKNYDRIFGKKEEKPDTTFFVCAQLISCDKCGNTRCIRKKKDEEKKEDDVHGSSEAGNA